MARGIKKQDKKTEGHEYPISKDITLVCFDWGKNQSTKLIVLDTFVIYGRIVEGKKGKYFMSFPSYKASDGTYKSTAFCIDSDIIAKINDAVNSFMEEDAD